MTSSAPNSPRCLAHRPAPLPSYQHHAAREHCVHDRYKRCLWPISRPLSRANAESRALLDRLRADGTPLILPTLLLVELAGVSGRSRLISASQRVTVAP